jgi:poly(A) polymerase
LMLAFTTPVTLVSESLAYLEKWERPVMPVKGGDLIEMGLAKGPRVSKMLGAVEKLWIEHGFPDGERTGRIALDVLRSAGVDARHPADQETSRSNGRPEGLGR